MTKKDYQAIARALHTTFVEAIPELVNAQAFHRRYVKAIADIMAADNPRFDRERFVEACETGKGV